MCTSRSVRTSCTFSKSSEPPRRKRLIDSLTAAASTAATRRPLPGAHLDHALGDERAHGLADDRARDAELLAELALRREPVADLEPPREDRLEHHVGDLVRQPRLARDLLEERRASLAGRRSSPRSSRASYVIRHASCNLDAWYAVV